MRIRLTSQEVHKNQISPAIAEHEFGPNYSSEGLKLVYKKEAFILGCELLQHLGKCRMDGKQPTMESVLLKLEIIGDASPPQTEAPTGMAQLVESLGAGSRPNAKETVPTIASVPESHSQKFGQNIRDKDSGEQRFNIDKGRENSERKSTEKRQLVKT